MAHTCQNCGAVADDPGHLCNPTDSVLDCSYCGAEDIKASHVCKDKLSAMNFSCDSCGRVAVNKDSLCSPKEIS